MPELVIRDKIIQLVVPDSSVWPKINKDVSVGDGPSATLMAYQYTKDIVRVRAVLPYNIKNLSSQVSVVKNPKSVDVFFPMADFEKEKNSYDESYLEKLLSDKEVSEMQETTNIEKSDVKEKEDTVGLRLSGQDKEKGFSMASYFMKFFYFPYGHPLRILFDCEASKGGGI